MEVLYKKLYGFKNTLIEYWVINLCDIHAMRSVLPPCILRACSMYVPSTQTLGDGSLVFDSTNETPKVGSLQSKAASRALRPFGSKSKKWIVGPICRD